MNGRTRALTVLFFLSCVFFTKLSQAQSPQIVWQLPYTTDKSYYSLEYTADSRQLFAGGQTNTGGPGATVIKRFDADTGTQIATTSSTGSQHFFGASDIALAPDGQKIITANFIAAACSPPNPSGCSSSYKQYDSSQLDRFIVPPGSGGQNRSVDYSPDGQLIALGGTQGIKIIRTSDFTVLRTLPGHPDDGSYNETLSVQFSPDGRLLGSSGRDRFVKLWRVADGVLVHSLEFDGAREVDSAAFSPDGQFIAAGRNDSEAQVKVWRVSNGALFQTFDVGSGYTYTLFNKVAWTPDGRYVVAGISFEQYYGGNSRIRFWNVQTGQLAQDYRTENQRSINDIKFSPNGLKFAWATRGDVIVALNPFPNEPFAGFRTFVDFDGDRKSDISVYRNGIWYLQQSTNGFRGTQFGLGSDKIVPADYDGDGKTDLAVVRDGNWYILNSANNSFRAVQWGFGSDVPVPGDYDGDGKADLAVFRQGVWYILQSLNSEIRAVQLGDANSKPVPADYDADAKADPGVFQNGAWEILRSTQGVANFVWGQTGDRAVPADYDGDGLDDPAVFKGSGVWSILRSNGGVSNQQFGIAADKPVPADYDGDGKTDLAVFRNGVWYQLQTTNGFSAIQFGLTDDVAVPSAFIP